MVNQYGLPEAGGGRVHPPVCETFDAGDRKQEDRGKLEWGGQRRGRLGPEAGVQRDGLGLKPEDNCPRSGGALHAAALGRFSVGEKTGWVGSFRGQWTAHPDDAKTIRKNSFRKIVRFKKI